VANSFVQSQTIENKRILESVNGDGRSEQEVRLAAMAGDPKRRRAYLWRQSMYESLEQEAAIA
jgi:3-(3-hydroxy-phenyl)propionate hydroxylase